MRKRSKLRTFLFSATTSIIGLGISLILLEFVAANFLMSDMETVGREFDRDLGWRYVPGTYKIKRQNSLVPHHIQIDEFGLRSNRTLDTDRHEIARIVVLGDSFTFGKAVPHEDIFTTRLERILNRHSNSRYQVINAGVEGYGTAQQLLLAKRLAKEGRVGDIYVLQVFTNDILDNLRLQYSSKSTVTLQPGYVLGGDNDLVLMHLPHTEKGDINSSRGAETGIRIFRVVREIMETHLQTSPALISLATGLGIQAKVPRMPGLINAWYDSDVLEDGLPLMRELIRGIQSEVQKQNAKLLVVFIPSPLMIYPQTYGPLLKQGFQHHSGVREFLNDVGKPRRLIVELCSEINVRLLDMYPILLAKNSRSLYFPREGHLTSDGHSVVAESLAIELGDEFFYQ